MIDDMRCFSNNGESFDLQAQIFALILIKHICLLELNPSKWVMQIFAILSIYLCNPLDIPEGKSIKFLSSGI